MAAHSTSSPNYCSNPTLAAAQMEYVREVWSGSYEGIRRQTLSLIDRTCSSAALQRLDLLEVEPCFIELRLGVDVFRNFKIAVLNHLNTKQLNQLVALNLSNFMPDPKGQTVLDLGIQILSKTNKLAYLYLNKFLFGEPPTPRPIQYTGGIEYLSTIYLSNPSITTGSIQTLDATKGTVEADLVEELPGKGHNGNPDLTKMGAALLANPRLLRLSMESNGISTAEAITGLQLDQHPSLQRLDLKKNPLDTKAIIKIAEIISLNSHLQHVNLSDCPLTVEGFEALGHMLTANDTLLELDLSKEKRHPSRRVKPSEGLYHLTSALRVNQTLQVLNLGGHALSPDHYIELYHATSREESSVASVGNISIAYLYNPEEEKSYIRQNTSIEHLSVLLAKRDALRFREKVSS